MEIALRRRLFQTILRARSLESAGLKQRAKRFFPRLWRKELAHPRLSNAGTQRHNDDSLNLPNFRRHVERVNPARSALPWLIPPPRAGKNGRAQSVITFNHSFSASWPFNRTSGKFAGHSPLPRPVVTRESRQRRTIVTERPFERNDSVIHFVSRFRRWNLPGLSALELTLQACFARAVSLVSSWFRLGFGATMLETLCF